MSEYLDNKKIYNSAQKFLALAQSEYGIDLRQKHPDLIQSAKDIIKKYTKDYVEKGIVENADAKSISIELKQASRILDMLSEDSFTEKKEVLNIIEEKAKQMQDVILFDPKTYYTKYKLSLISPITEDLADEVEKNTSFAVWFLGSKVHADGEPRKPIVVYHGTGGITKEFDKFKFDTFPAAYFAINKSYSDWFASIKGGKSMLYKCYLRVLNPMDLSEFGLQIVKYKDIVMYVKLRYGIDLPEIPMLKTMSDARGGMLAWQYLRSGVAWLNFIKSKKEFDGIIYYENNPQDIINGEENTTKAVMVFNGEQIKSADVVNTTYSLVTDNIKMEKGGQLC